MMMLDTYIGLKRQDNVPFTIQEKMLVVMGYLGIGPRPATLPTKDEIVGVMVQDVEVGLNRSATFNCSIMDKVWTVMGEVDIVLRPALITPIIQVIFMENWVFIFMLMKKVDIGIRSTNLPHITMMN